MSSKQRRQILDFFRNSLDQFQQSNSSFAVIATLRRAGSRTQRHDAASDDFPIPIPAPAEPVASPRRLIVLDSSFNPPTRAHMRMADSTIRSLTKETDNDARLLLLLAVKNADKAPKPASFAHRLAMMWACAVDLQADQTQENEARNVPIDVGLTTHPFFHDKSTEIAASAFYGGSPPGEQGPEQVFLAGYDTLIRIFNPKYFTAPSPDPASEMTPMQAALDPFFARARLRITMRPDDEWGSRADQLVYIDGLGNLEESGGRGSWAERVEMVEGRSKEETIVSSTAARRAAKKGEWNTLGEFVGPCVRTWIEEEGLYADGDD